jgi:cyanophycin synthetase
MRILERRTYMGPNLYAHFRVIRFLLDLGPLEEYPSAKIPGFVERLLALLPGLREHGCSYGEPGGFARRLAEDEGTWMGHVLEHVALEIQHLAGYPVTFGKTRGSGKLGQYHVVYEYDDPWVGMAAGELALRVLHSLIPQHLIPDQPHPDEPGAAPPFEFLKELETLILDTQTRAFGPSTASLVRAAEARDIPWIRIGEASLVQFGHSCHQKRIWATITSETRHIAVEIASDKSLTNQILADMGLPVPKQFQVRNVEDAARAFLRIGNRVVVKPLNANHGRGVAIGLTTEEAVRAAFENANQISRTVLVESCIDGLDHRLLVVAGRLVAASKRVPGHVVGDGERTIAQLVELVNSDPRRGIGHEMVLTRLEIDAQAQRLMADAGYTEQTVLPAGQIFYLRSTGNLSTGGTAIDVTDQVHPDNREMAERATAAVGLDVCGVDFLTPDITKSWTDVGGAICEVNAAPGFRMHVSPSEGQPRDVAGAVMEMLFPPGTPTRIPIAAITGTNGKTTTSRMLAHIHKMAGAVVGLTTTDGVYIDGNRTVPGDMTGPVSAQMVLRDPKVQVAVLETARGGLLRAGMGYKRPNVACCLNVAGDHLGMGGIDTLEQLAEVKRIPIEVASDCVVLNADDPLCLGMADYAAAKRVAYVTMNPEHELVREHLRNGGLAVGLEGGVNGQMITVYDRMSHMPLLWTHLIPATMEGKALHNVQNAMFAAAMAYAMGVKLDDIRHGLRTFDTSFFQAPGRMNVYDELGFRVILDYGHNPHAIDAMCNLVDRLSDGTGMRTKRVVLLTAPGDRRDEDLRSIAVRAACSFDIFICKEDDDTRGRAKGEVPGKLRDFLVENGVHPGRIHVVPHEVQALDLGLRTCRSGDLLVVFGDNLTRCWKQIIYFGRDHEGAVQVVEQNQSWRPAPPGQMFQAPPTPAPSGPLVIDERGVRLPRVQESSD